MNNLGFTGTRNGMTPAQLAALREIMRNFRTLHHGDCIGADAQAHYVARELGLRIEIHPPRVSKLRAWCGGDVIHEPAEYMARNRAIVRASQRLVAAPFEATEQEYGGTWATIQTARRMDVQLTIVFPDGSLGQ